jgi:UDP-glucose 4-epimerase
LCDAHVKALEWLNSGGASAAFNLGNDAGFSVAEVVEAVGRVTGNPVPVIEGSRRAGDPARLVADSSHARQLLGWKPQYGDLDTIISHAWIWEKKMCNR